MALNIHYLTPYSVSGNIGQAYNKACSLVPREDDWIVIRDGDTMFMTPEWGKVIEENLLKHGHEYGLLGAVTNRVNDYHQKVFGMFDEMDMRAHYKMAKLLQETKRNDVIKTEFDIAGFFMAFKKSTWREVGGFEENTPLFDRIFTRAVRKFGHNVGFMNGLYVLHSYRIWSADPTADVAHLGL